MEPRFSDATDPVIVATLELIERTAVGETASPSEERTRLKTWIEDAEARIGRTEEWDLARYALVCWIDAALVKAQWVGSEFWNNNPLEVEYYHIRKAFTEFFKRAEEARATRKKNALEIFYLCVVFGYRGMYDPPPEERKEGERPGDFDLPNDIETWASEVRAELNLKAGRAPLDDKPRAIAGAPPLSGKSSMLTSLVLAAMLLAIPIGYLVWKQMSN